MRRDARLAQRDAEAGRAARPPAADRGAASAPGGAPLHSEHARLAALQRAAGNHAVASLLGQHGRPLEPSTRSAMEASFGESFADVRVHVDDAGDAAARETGARALALGSEIAFRDGEYEPDTLPGQRLIAHELAHVVQQRNAPIESGAVEAPDSAAEREAHAAASDATAGRAANPVSAAPGGIPRDVGWARRGEIPDPHGMGYNTIFSKAGADSKGAVLALTSLETPSMFVDLERYKKLDAQVRKSILALEPHAAGTGCAGWFDVMRANDPDFKPKLTPEQIRAGEAAYHASTREAALQKKTEAAKAELPKLDPVAIDAKWKDNKSGLISAAQAPNHGIKADTLHAIWVKYWADRIAIADSTLNALIATELHDHVDLSDTDGYRKAEATKELGFYLLADSVGAIEICRAADAAGKSLTLDELTERVISHSKFMEGMQLLAAVLSAPKVEGGGGRRAKGASGRTAPVKTEPVKAEPVKTEPVKTEPVKAEPVKTEPVKTQPVKAEPVKSEPVKTEPVKTKAPTAGETKTAEGPKPPVKNEPEATKSPEVKQEPQVKKEPAATKEPAQTKEPEGKPQSPKAAEKPAEGAKEEPEKPPQSKPPTVPDTQKRLGEIRSERAANDAAIKEKYEKRAAAQQRSRDAAAKIPKAAESEKQGLRDQRDRNAATADKLQDEIDRLRIRNNRLAAEEAQLAPSVVKPQTWQEAENALRKEFSGQKKTFVLQGANREVDCFSPDGIAREGKFGPQGLSPQIQGEINKDLALVKSGAVKGVEWHFYENPQTGIGPSGPLKDALRDAGFKIVIH